MTKNYILLWLVILAAVGSSSTQLKAQSPIDRRVIGSSGGSATVGSGANAIDISFTVGEVSVGSFSAVNAQLTAGFQQPVFDNTLTTITSHLPNPSVVGQVYTVAVSVSALSGGSPTPEGYVTLSDGTGSSCTVTLGSGTGSCQLTSTSPGAKTLTATYEGSATFAGSSATATQQVNPANTAPMVATAISSQTATLGASYSFTIPATTFTDAETPNSLTLAVSGLPAGLSFVSPSTITGVPSTTLGSPFNVSVVATDPGGLSAVTTFSLSVAPAGFAITSATMLDCNHISYYARRINFNVSYSGTNGQPISLSVVNELLATTYTGPFSLTVYTDNPVITITARQQGTPGMASFNYNWQAYCANGSPMVLNPVPPQSATLGAAFSYTIPATTFTDAETPNSLTLSVNGLPLGLSFVSPNTITGVPSTTLGTPYNVTVTAVDPGGQSVSTTFQLNVVNPNGCVSMYSVKVGVWSDPTVWSCNRVPLSTDVVTVNHAVSLPASYEGFAQRLLYSAGGRLIFGSGSRLRLSGN
ncbi:Ig-like domain repeat protein [Spirosoma sp. BT702]|uniref:Ig-like domain repeat protein n=1 Tax=Spirosoma profusum TaxID=2771354 RepID=A0A926XZ94_9BACT|nr:putative Ig domain-containing protein [Spirosoma profusum]MBD2699020.1 Ig-like domain repeat protein [Spirosoma profusum]